MLDRAVTINKFQLSYFSRIVEDLPEESMFQPAAGHGHLPIWVLGHLAICAEFGQKLLGGEITHPEWLPVFGPGSSGEVEPSDAFHKTALATATTEGYAQFQAMASDEANQPLLERDHGIALFEGSPIATVGDAAAVLLTNHFGFHLAQLSSCRREAGKPHLF